MELKPLPALLNFYELSLSKASKCVFLFQKINHKSIRIHYHRLKKVLKPPKKKKTRLIKMDELKLKLEELEDKHILVWSAIDVDTKECLAVWALKRRGLDYKHESFWREKCCGRILFSAEEKNKGVLEQVSFREFF